MASELIQGHGRFQTMVEKIKGIALTDLRISAWLAGLVMTLAAVTIALYVKQQAEYQEQIMFGFSEVRQDAKETEQRVRLLEIKMGEQSNVSIRLQALVDHFEAIAKKQKEQNQ